MNLVPKNHLLQNLIYIYPTYYKYSHILLQKYYRVQLWFTAIDPQDYILYSVCTISPYKIQNLLNSWVYTAPNILDGELWIVINLETEYS